MRTDTRSIAAACLLSITLAACQKPVEQSLIEAKAQAEKASVIAQEAGKTAWEVAKLVGQVRGAFLDTGIELSQETIILVCGVPKGTKPSDWVAVCSQKIADTRQKGMLPARMKSAP